MNVVLLDMHRARQDRLIRMGARPPRLVVVDRKPEPPTLIHPQCEDWTFDRMQEWMFAVEEFVEPPAKFSIEGIKKAVAKHFGIRLIDMCSERRAPKLTVPRQISFYLCRELTGRSFPEIGRRHGDRDHTTVMHGIGKITRLCAENGDWREIISQVKATVFEEASQ